MLVGEWKVDEDFAPGGMMPNGCNGAGHSVIEQGNLEGFHSQRRKVNPLVLHSCSQPGSHGRSRKNAHSDSQPRGGPKRTESGLSEAPYRRKFFTIRQLWKLPLKVFASAD
jgi:hypothetical protein